MGQRAKGTSRAVGAGVALAALLASAPAVGAPQSEVRETRPAARDMRLEIGDIVVGSVQITGWDREEMEVVGRLGRDVASLEIDGDPEGYEIRADQGDWNGDWQDWRDDRWRQREQNRHQDVDVELEIRVPRGASLDIEVVTAPIRVQGVDGRVELETVTGMIEYRGDADDLALTTVTGDIRAHGGALDEGRFETVQGSITWTGSFASGAEVSFETVGGGVELVLPADVSAAFDVETTTGDIDSDFGVQAERVSRWASSQEIHFSIGDGDARVSIETLQGGVRLRRQ